MPKEAKDRLAHAKGISSWADSDTAERWNAKHKKSPQPLRLKTSPAHTGKQQLELPLTGTKEKPAR